jgi:hypothetical protein
MTDQENLTKEEVKALKELAQNLMAMGRVKRAGTAILLWLAAIVGASWLLWDKVLSHIRWGDQ